MKNRNAKQVAFTLLELLVVIAIIAMLAALQLPSLANTKSRVQIINCSDNLRRIGVASRTWADNHNGLRPMSATPPQGGASSAVGVVAQGANMAANWPVTGPRGVFGMFAVMSNILVTPKILFCPSEYRTSGAKAINQALIWGNSSSTNQGFFSDFQTSYFVGVDSVDTKPFMMMAGDHNLGTGVNQATIFGDTGPNFTSAGTNNTLAMSIGFADNMHNKSGNVLLADASCQSLSTSAFRKTLDNTGQTAPNTTSAVFTLSAGASGLGINRLQFP